MENKSKGFIHANTSYRHTHKYVLFFNQFILFLNILIHLEYNIMQQHHHALCIFRIYSKFERPNLDIISRILSAIYLYNHRVLKNSVQFSQHSPEIKKTRHISIYIQLYTVCIYLYKYIYIIKKTTCISIYIRLYTVYIYL